VIIVAVLGFVGGFVLTMTFMGISPWEAVGVALAAGTATGTITRVLLDLLGPSRTDKPAPPEPPIHKPVSPEPPVDTPRPEPPTGGPAKIPAPAEPRPEEIVPAPTEEAST
jgi:hypothetical protein